MFGRGLLLLCLVVFGGWVRAQSTIIESEQFCNLQTCLEEGAAMAMAKQNVAAIALLSEYVDSFPAQLDPATERLKAEYLYHIGYAAYYKCLAVRNTEDHELCNASLKFADSLISKVEGRSSTLKARILRMRGQCEYFLSENPLDAQDFYEAAYRTWLLAPQKDSVELASVLQCMGQAATKQGEFQRAIDLYRHSLEIRERIFGHTHFRVGKAYWDLGNAYGYSYKFQEAADAYQTALEILNTAKPDDHLMIANIMTNLASCYNQLGNYEASVQNINVAIGIKREFDAYYSPELIKYYSILAVSLASQNKFTNAEHAIAEMAEICNQNHVSFGANLALLWLSKARVQMLKKASPEIVLAPIQAAMGSISTNEQLADWQSYPDVLQSSEPLLLQQIILEKAKFLNGAAKESPLRIQMLLASLKGYELVTRLSDRLRTGYEGQDDKLFLSSQSSLFLQDAIDCAYLIWQNNPDQEYVSRSFKLMENGKFQLLLDFFRKSRIHGSIGVSRVALTKLDELRRRCTELDYLMALPDIVPDSLRKFQTELIDKRIQQRSLQDSLEYSSRLYKTMYGQQSTASIDSVRQLLPPGAAMISYSISDSLLFIIEIQKKSSSFRRVSLPPNFADSVGQWVDLCRRPIEETIDIQNFNRLGYFLYEILLGPELKASPSLDQLLLIPDGILGHIPFEALITEKQPAEATSFVNLPYLIKQYPVYYAASGTLWCDQQKMIVGSSEMNCLGIAWGPEPVSNIAGVRGEIRGLKGTEEELNTIQSMVEGQYFVASEASEANFKTLAPQFDILHLALHARATESDPQILFPAAGDAQEDGILHFHELFPLHLNSRLAVLSACETGTGKLIQGEGIQSMSSGFASAGVPSVLMSLWEVDDEAGGQIMQSFYEGIADGSRIDLSLQKAKLNYLENAPGLKNAPFYWSAFVPMGNMAPLKLATPSRFSWWMIVGGSVGLLCIFILFRIYLKNRKSI